MIRTFTAQNTKSLLALALALLVTAAPALAADKMEYSHGEFERALGEALRTAARQMNLTSRTGDPSEVVKEIEPHEGGWKATIHGAWFSESDVNQINSLTLPALIANHGDRLEYAFYGQPVPRHLAQGVRNHKGMLNAEKVWLKEHKDIQMTIGLDTNRVTLTATYSYAKGVSAGDITKRLEWLFRCSSSLMVWSEYARREVAKEYLQALNGRKLTQLSKEELEVLVDDGLEEWVSKNHQAEAGAWFFNYKKRPMYIFNHGKSIDFAHYYEIPESIQGENRQKVLQAVQEYVSKKKMAKASRQEVTWSDAEKQDATWVKITFDLDGNIKGEDLKKAYFEFYQKYTLGLEQAIEKIIADQS